MGLSALGGALKSLAWAYAPPMYNVFLHGLFFLEAKKRDDGKWVLEIKAPKVTGHILLGGARKNLSIIQDVDFTQTVRDLPFDTPTFKDNDPNKNPIPLAVKPSILQFSKDETKVGNLKLYDKSIYHGRVTLPWSNNIHALRRDYFPYTAMGQSVVADKIKARCTRHKIGTVTCIQYPYKIPGAYHTHLLMCDPEDTCYVNYALKEARKVFETGANFDFSIPETGVKNTPTDDPSLPGVSREDENSEKEDEPTKWEEWCNDQPMPQIGCVKNVSPANCPHFFVG
jgi:hypothetical protein